MHTTFVLSGSFGDCADTRRKRKMLEEEGVCFKNGKVSASLLLKLCDVSTLNLPEMSCTDPTATAVDLANENCAFVPLLCFCV